MVENKTIEEWRSVVGFGEYMVSNLGRVKSLGNDKNRKEKILRPGKDRDGYLYVDLCRDGNGKRVFVHRLVWEAFNGEIPEGMQINHNDEVKTNNNLENLSLMTPKENTNWGTRNKRVAKTLSKKVEQYTLDGVHICTWFSTIGIKRELGYARQNISGCCNGKYKTSYGYIWKFAE